MKIRDLLHVALAAESLDDDVVFELEQDNYIDAFNVNAEYNSETRVLILKEAKE